MAKPDLSWENFPEGWLAEVLDYVSSRGGTVVCMFGGYGYYYKLSWQWEDKSYAGRVIKNHATGETPIDLMRLVQARLYGLRWDD